MKFKSNETPQKLRGGYYTSKALSQFLVRWVSHISPTRILEPSCGDGVFFESIRALKSKINVVGYEIDLNEAKKALNRVKNPGKCHFDIRAVDFLGWALQAINGRSERFDAVVGNPPFIRYQYLPSSFQTQAKAIFDKLNCRFTKHTNAWVSFILASLSLLRPGGRLGMVVPSEIIHVMHAQSLRDYLGQHTKRLVILDPEELWFEGTLQGAVLLLAEKKDINEKDAIGGIGIHPIRGREFLHADPEHVFNLPPVTSFESIDRKWTYALLAQSTRDLLQNLLDAKFVCRFKDVAQVDVGIVTGANKYFLVSNETVQKFGLQTWAYPMFGRSEHCPGVIYDEDQHHSNERNGRPTNFIWFKDNSVENDIRGSAYVRLGIQENFHTRYKCRVRNPWYAVPSVYSTEIGMLKRSHDTPRLILNRLGAYTTDTAYRIRSISSLTSESLVYCFLNGMTALSAELEGRHYGGGVLEMVPSEIERLLVPSTNKIEPRLPELDEAVKKSSMDKVLASQTDHILGCLGLSMADREELLASWSKLRNRRHRVNTSND